MLVLDSNIWILALVEASDEHVAVRDRVIRGEDRTVVDAYIYEEVLDGLRRSESVSGADTQATIKDFVNLVQTSEYIDSPSYAEVPSVELPDVRARRENITLGRVLGIQPKDAPIVTLAHAYADRETRHGSAATVTIITSDRTFAELNPNAHGLPLSMQYIPYTEE